MKDYQISRKTDTEALTRFMAANGQMIAPMVDLIESSQLAVDQLLEDLGRATLQAVLRISADGVAGQSHQGKRGGEIVRHGSQTGKVTLSNRKIHVDRPRLRRKEGGSGAEVEVPAYEAMKADGSMGKKVFEAMMCCVSTRNYGKILPDACEAAGVSKSSISREFVQASEQAFKSLGERSFKDKEILIIYIDGIVFDEHNVIAAVGIDANGYKHVLGVVEGATENATVVKSLLEGMVERGIKSGVRRLFVIDGSKALRAAIDAVYGSDNPVQRCRAHKIRNVTDHLPRERKDYVKAAIRAAFRLKADEGQKRLEELAKSLERDWPGAAASLREGLPEMFTVARLGIPSSLARSLVTTNIIESPNAGVRMRTRRVTRWQGGSMVLRWAAAAFLETEKRFRRVSGFADLRVVKTVLGNPTDQAAKAA